RRAPQDEGPLSPHGEERSEAARLEPSGHDLRFRYFGGCFGTMALSFSRSTMFIFMPPGITMSPGFWSGLQAPSHFASMVVVESRGAPLGPRSLCEVDFTV